MDNELPQLLGNLTDRNAWAYVYAITMWAEKHDGKDYLHIVESDKLKSKAGRVLAERAADYLAANMVVGAECDPFEVVDHIGRAYIAERARQGFGPPQKKRDPNVTGAAFETSLQVIIGKLCGVIPSRTPDLRTLQGFELAPQGYHSRPDLVLFGPRDFRLLISTKWTLRKERIGTYLHESYFYRRRRPDLQIAFGVNEFQPNILGHLSTDPLVDRVYHVNKRMLLELYRPFTDVPPEQDVPQSSLIEDHKNAKDYRRWLQMRDKLFDLTDLFADITSLMNTPEQVLDPGPPGDADDGLGDD
ncbi:hypothetical protein [Gordonia sp. C13]|uniref:hypothetical protein n=1 Tax=Gordonia sp. C13 TaxID=2935078 RepID=UPI002009FA0A|nr:hypothetical protein [Gordonia sp. C13]MCK8616134.1 hypothetical protein [Gordonia sp. C13]